MGYEIHPFAKLLPPLSEEELKDLAKDIGENGQKLPIIRHKGKIIDGVNRLKACEIAGVEPVIKDVDGAFETEVDIALFISSINLKRRHITPSERAAIAVELLEVSKKACEKMKEEFVAAVAAAEGEGKEPPEEKTAKPMSVKEAAKATQASVSTIKVAQKVKDEAPEKFQEVKAGKKTVNSASREISAAQSDEKSEKVYERKAHKLVEATVVKLAEFGYRLLDATIEKMD